MSTVVVAIVLAAIFAVLVTSYLWLDRRRSINVSRGMSIARLAGPLSRVGQRGTNSAAQQRGLVVMSGDQALMSMSVLDNAALPALVDGATKLSAGGFTRVLEPIMQVAPSIGTAAMANSRRLFEVVVDGKLAAASDGNGLRAWVTNASGIKQHGRLFEPTSLQNVANAAAIWQIVSVAVAQKHLADISATLKRVESKVDGIQRYMEAARFAVIQSVMNYLRAAKDAVANGEFLERTRVKLEDFDVELERAALSLIDQIRREADGELAPDAYGSGERYKSALAKHQKLSRHVDELTLCNEVRLANWYLCSLYPDQSKVLEPRLAHIRTVLEQTRSLGKHLEHAAVVDCDEVHAVLNFHSTLIDRRNEIREVSAGGVKALLSGGDRCDNLAEQLSTVRSERLGVNRLIVESENGVPISVYMRSNAA